MAVRALHELEQTDRKKGHGAMEQDEKQKAVKALLADFSEEHLSIVWWFFREYKLPVNDRFEIIALRYLLTVKRWSTLPELRRYSFTIGCVCHEICRQHREA